jgi:flagellar export protein FliJ
MKSFQFRLQAVLTLREQAEQAAQQRCARAYEAVERATGRLRSAEAAIAAVDELRGRELSAGARADRLEQLGNYTVLLHERRTVLVRELAEARGQAEAARRQLLFATQQRETLERLRQRQRRKHDYAAAQAEQKLLDDLAGRRETLLDTWRDPLPV